MTAEHQRLSEERDRSRNWKRWGPYLSERQWGTVREDYSATGECWDYFSHDAARSRAYRWGEDGLLGFTDRECRLCFALALWNGKDPILKERLFGLTGPEGNHGEDVKEAYFYLDSTPTHSYAKALYKYPQAAFPYDRLVAENQKRGREELEFELLDTGLFDEGRYFDVMAEYAKESPDDILIRITVSNRGPEAATLHLLPTLWFRNTWIWGCRHEGCTLKPSLRSSNGELLAEHETLGAFHFAYDRGPDGAVPPVLFTENESNSEKLFGTESYTPYVKDAFHAHVVDGKKGVVNPELRGTKAAPHYVLQLAAGETQVVRLRLFPVSEAAGQIFGTAFDQIFEQRRREADAFYETVIPPTTPAEARNVARQAYAGLLWSKQFYHYVVDDWLEGDTSQPPPPEARKQGRNREWKHLFARDVLSMPDKWEYPWFAAWDLAFHMIPFCKIDPEFAKQQLSLLLREWYLHPNGQMPAYEFAFGDVNPPVHAWAIWRVYKMTAPKGKRDRAFLESAFHKLLLNFTWWVNRKDADGVNLFSGGFLGLDNIGVFDRSKPLPGGAMLHQADGTAWMAFFCLTMLSISLELAEENRAYEDMASKFFEHFVAIADAINHFDGVGLWDEEEGFYFDRFKRGDCSEPLKTRSLVGLIPLLAVEILDESKIEKMPGFKKRMDWFLKYRRDVANSSTYCDSCSVRKKRILAIPSKERLLRALRPMLDEAEFLSRYGLRSLSKWHGKNPSVFELEGEIHRVDYVPGESTTGLFGGNSNWRGPVWFPVNYLLVEALERYHYFWGDDLKVEFPTGSGLFKNLQQVADALSMRMSALFLPGQDGQRPCHGGERRFASDPWWKQLVLFHEYFHGEHGEGLGASHQTGWTALVARLLPSNQVE